MSWKIVVDRIVPQPNQNICYGDASKGKCVCHFKLWSQIVSDEGIFCLIFDCEGLDCSTECRKELVDYLITKIGRQARFDSKYHGYEVEASWGFRTKSQFEDAVNAFMNAAESS